MRGNNGADSAAFPPAPDPIMSRTFVLSSLYMLAITLLALPYGLAV
jgi:hypothetical protein